MSIHGLYPSEQLQKLSELQSLSVTTEHISSRHFAQNAPRAMACVEVLFGLKGLIKLDAVCADLSEGNAVIRCSNLVELRLGGLNGHMLKDILTNCPKLETIQIRRCDNASIAFKGASLPRLHSLTLAGVIVSDRIFARFIKRCPELQFFEANICSIGDRTCVALASSKLKHFQVRDTKVTSTGLKHVFVPSLEVFISDVTPTLPKEINLSRIHLKDCDLATFKQLIDRVQDITIISAHFNGSIKGVMPEAIRLHIQDGIFSQCVLKYLSPAEDTRSSILVKGICVNPLGYRSIEVNVSIICLMPVTRRMYHTHE
jgi:hypothetical protein